MDLSEDERANCLESMPTATWTRQDQARYAAILVVIADRDEIGLTNAGLKRYPDTIIPGLPAPTGPTVTLPEILTTPISQLVAEVTALTKAVVRVGALGPDEMTRLAILSIAIGILKDPSPGPYDD